MSFVKFLNWCTTENGKKTASYVATGVIASVGMAHLLPQTVFIENYVDFLHRYRNGFTVPISDEIKAKFETVLEMLQIPEEEKALYKPFNIIGFDVGSIGSSFSKWGVRVGIPGNFEYKSTTDVATSRISLMGDKLVWESEVGQKLRKSLIVSDNAQYYAIAREIKMRQTPKLWIDTVVGLTCTFGTYAISNAANRKFNLFAKPLLVRVMLYALVTTFSLGNYFLVKDFSQIHYEQSVDAELKEKFPLLAEGAKDYYTKLLLRNMCLRNILEKEGENLFSPYGNENYFIRMKTTPLMQRREFFE